MSTNILPKNVENALKGIANDFELKKISIQVKSGSQAGDGFSSEMRSVNIKGLQDSNLETELNLLCKLPPENENRRKDFLSHITFEKEICLYTKVLPAFIHFQREKLIQEADQFRAYPKCYKGLGVDGKEDYAIIMEDLRPKGFQMWNKMKPTTLGNIRLVLEQIGKFHAISLAMKDQRPDEFAEFKKFTDILGPFIATSNMRGMFDTSFERAKKFLHDDHHKELISKVQANLVEYVFMCVNESVCGDFAVLSHGDLWNNNIMYHFDENNIVDDVRFVDWQTIRYVSPAIDLINHIFAATDKPLRDAEYMNLLRHYHDSLSQMMQKLGSDPHKLFSFDNLLGEMKRYGTYSFITLPITLSVCMADSSQIANLDEVYSEDTDGKRNNKDLITGISDDNQIEYETRLNDAIGDLVDLGYFKELN